MKKLYIFIISSVLIFSVQAQNKICKYEYWVDDDFAGRIAASVTPVHDLHLQTNLPMELFSIGLHTLNIRFADETGHWSNVMTQTITKHSAGSSSVNNITAVEYWVDDDYGNRIEQEITGSQYYHFMDHLNLVSATPGFHMVHLRFKDNMGIWSNVLTQYFEKIPVTNVQSNDIYSYHFWFDNDLSSMETITLAQPMKYMHPVDSIETPFLTVGKHAVNYQFKDSLRAFSSAKADTFIVTSCLPHGGRVITGSASVCAGQTSIVYSIRKIKNAASYTWSLPPGATIVSGNNTYSITVDYSLAAASGNISVYATNSCGNGATLIFPVTVYPPTIAGAVTGSGTIFFGMETNLNLEGKVGSVLKWQKRWNSGAWQDIANVTTEYTDVPDTTGIWDYRAEVCNGPCSSMFSDFATITVQPVSRTINLKVFLEGLFNPLTGQMNKAQDEYGDKYQGMVADKIQVRLANPEYPYSIYYSKDDVDLNQDGNCTFTLPRIGSYYLVIKQRNSIETWSSAPISLFSEPVSYDFSTTSSQAFGDNLKDIDGVYTIWSGDVNQDGIVDAGDMNPVDNATTAITFGYVAEDVNGDGIVDAGDMNIADNNTTAIIMAIVP